MVYVHGYELSVEKLKLKESKKTLTVFYFLPVCAYAIDVFHIPMYVDKEETNFPNASGKIVINRYLLSIIVPTPCTPKYGKNGVINKDADNN